jgi:hypothetical protein
LVERGNKPVSKGLYPSAPRHRRQIWRANVRVRLHGGELSDIVRGGGMLEGLYEYETPLFLVPCASTRDLPRRTIDNPSAFVTGYASCDGSASSPLVAAGGRGCGCGVVRKYFFALQNFEKKSNQTKATRQPSGSLKTQPHYSTTGTVSIARWYRVSTY